ncbi:VOC family protein [Raineyella fluvialis]|uniref:VOC family protein n=1 Tax=Raineyella fluvialis TaxID=2662261 RepID=UPI00188FB33B
MGGGAGPPAPQGRTARRGGAGRPRPGRPGPAHPVRTIAGPLPGRNRVRVDVWVSHDEAERRIEHARAAGGRLVSEAHAPAFWVLADAEGNIACLCTWQGRDWE